MYDSTTYAKLAQLWEKYYDAYPSEDAYANWMYAAFYANRGDVRSMIEKGVEKYPANPVLLYLSARSKNWGHDNLHARQLLEKAAALDPDYMDAWHALAVEYIVQGDRENADVALRRLLNGRASRMWSWTFRITCSPPWIPTRYLLPTATMIPSLDGY
jgi:tetratricopeptide (TPR) repeat protein